MTNVFKIKHFLPILFLCICSSVYGQQDPHYSQYSYNTMTANPGYTGSRGHLAMLSLYRSQWVGIEGSPRTITFGIDAPIGLFNGIGLSILQDELGPTEETYIDANYAHNLILNRKGDRLAFGVKAGARFFSADWSKGTHLDPDPSFNENINSKLLPTVGVGVFYYTKKGYLGLSTPNVLTSQHYNHTERVLAKERIHLFLIAGYVFDINSELKFKPSLFVKGVSGAPISLDISANFLLFEKLHLGANYRWSDSVSALLGFQISTRFNIGYAFDYTTTPLNNFNSGTHEIFLRYQLISKLKKLRSPRFF
ncbi:MAG: type IX secretion system membrane protein PorP/SprF [Cellulophaga sp.]